MARRKYVMKNGRHYYATVAEHLRRPKSKRGTAAHKRKYTLKRKRKDTRRRGCGKRNWRRGSNAYWKCKTGKRRTYRR